MRAGEQTDASGQGPVGRGGAGRGPAGRGGAGRSTGPRYLVPGWLTRNVFNRAVAWSTRRGISIYGSRVLAVRGRRSGAWQRTPVNPLALEGAQYLVSPRGTTQWVRNLRAASGAGELRLGRRSVAFSATELADADKPEVLRAYLRRWKWEVGQFFEGIGPESSDADLVAAGHKHPVFRIDSAGGKC
ncbi:MAG TPA: nitroreductase/quinone reductase family protein [Acidimicrobiales bacterium]|nr:nitroreductase/quinone reductase family protein [Acidimicrobiales bacterium]